MRSSSRLDTWTAIAGSQETHSGARTLLSLLELACGSAAFAGVVLDRALSRARLDDLPRAPSDLVTFVRRELLRILSETVGPHLANALCNELVASLGDAGPSSGSQARVRGRTGGALAVAMVDPDCVRRTAMARALVGEGWDVRVIDSVVDVEQLSDQDEWVHVALVDATHPTSRAILERLAGKHPGLAAIVRAADPAKGHRLSHGLHIDSVDVVSADSAADEAVKAIRRAPPWYGSG